VATCALTLEDDSVFVKTWAIASLTILTKKNMDKVSEVSRKLRAYQSDDSIAIRTRVAKALEVLEHGRAIPSSWMKARD